MPGMTVIVHADYDSDTSDTRHSHYATDLLRSLYAGRSVPTCGGMAQAVWLKRHIPTSTVTGMAQEVYPYTPLEYTS